jgi:transcriptional regulator with XRE-family HTH domain
VKHTRHREVDQQVLVFAENLRRERRRACLSRAALADSSGLDRTAIALLERADRAPGLSTLLSLARALGLPPAKLLAGRGTDGSPLRGPNHGGVLPANNAIHFGLNLRWARRRVGISQETLARLAGIDRAAVGVYERGAREPNLRTILKLSGGLDVHPATLLRGIR